MAAIIAVLFAMLDGAMVTLQGLLPMGMDPSQDVPYKLALYVLKFGTATGGTLIFFRKTVGPQLVGIAAAPLDLSTLATLITALLAVVVGVLALLPGTRRYMRAASPRGSGAYPQPAEGHPQNPGGYPQSGPPPRR